MASQIQRQARHPKRSRYCDMWHNRKAEHIWAQCGIWYLDKRGGKMGPSSGERKNHRQALTGQRQHSCSPCEESNTYVVLIVCTPSEKFWRWVHNATGRLCEGKSLIRCQKVRGTIRAVKAVWYTRVFQTETMVVADVMSEDSVHLLT